MKEHFFEPITQLGGWYMPANFCDTIVNYYKENKKLSTKGTIGPDIVNSDIKDSMDLRIELNNRASWILDYAKYLTECIKSYGEKYEDTQKLPGYGVVEPFNIQYYEKGGGFKKWHYEWSYRSAIKKNRVLVFMTYLNDVEDGGTEFKYQGLTAPAKKGLTLIWPAHWTHTHRGQISQKNEKYIATGWFGIAEEGI
tara:strand:+ start:618 stop:1205 length:588 start_codon:yes stop_codon:yes gene_type:complete